MKANIFSHEKLIGTTELQVGDESMGCLYGTFLPTDNYYKHIQKSVWEFWSSSKTDYVKWNSLRLNIQLENGYFLFPEGGITLDDLEDLPEEPIRIDIAGVNSHVIEDFFLKKDPRPFVLEPWESISIEQKIAFEDELRKEIKIDRKYILNPFKSHRTGNPLAGFEISALCHNQQTDDILFATKKPDFEKQFAVIHLTWRGHKEGESYPKFEFFNNFDDFNNYRMQSDKAEWGSIS